MEVFVMSNKLQAKDLINLGLFRSLLCDWLLCRHSRRLCTYLFADPRSIVVFDYRHPVHAVLDQS